MTMSNTQRTPIRLLIVDDDEQMRRTLVGRFQRKGLTVSNAGSGEEALAIAAKARFDVALLDLHLPGMSGIELLDKLKERQPELEALLLTAHGSIETAIQAMKKGAYDYLTKPFHLPDLEIHIQKAFEKVQLARRERRLVQHLHRESPRHRLVGSSPAMQKIAALIEKVAPTDATVLVRGAERHGQGAGGPRAPRQQPAARPPAGDDQLRRLAGDPAGERAVRPREGRLHRGGAGQAGPGRGGRGRHAVHRRDRRDGARACRPSCCACWRTATTAASAARRSSGPTCASSPPRTARWRRRSRRTASARTCTTASTSSRCACRRCASGGRTSPNWSSIS